MWKVKGFQEIRKVKGQIDFFSDYLVDSRETIRNSLMPIKSIVFDESLYPLTRTHISSIGCPIIWHSCLRVSYLLFTLHGPNHSTSSVIPWPSSRSFQSAEHRSFLFHLMGHTIYIPSSLITPRHRSFYDLPLGHFNHQNIGHFCSNWSDILSTCHRS